MIMEKWDTDSDKEIISDLVMMVMTQKRLELILKKRVWKISIFRIFKISKKIDIFGKLSNTFLIGKQHQFGINWSIYNGIFGGERLQRFSNLYSCGSSSILKLAATSSPHSVEEHDDEELE